MATYLLRLEKMTSFSVESYISRSKQIFLKQKLKETNKLELVFPSFISFVDKTYPSELDYKLKLKNQMPIYHDNIDSQKENEAKIFLLLSKLALSIDKTKKNYKVIIECADIAKNNEVTIDGFKELTSKRLSMDLSDEDLDLL